MQALRATPHPQEETNSSSEPAPPPAPTHATMTTTAVTTTTTDITCSPPEPNARRDTSAAAGSSRNDHVDFLRQEGEKHDQDNGPNKDLNLQDIENSNVVENSVQGASPLKVLNPPTNVIGSDPLDTKTDATRRPTVPDIKVEDVQSLTDSDVQDQNDTLASNAKDAEGPSHSPDCRIKDISRVDTPSQATQSVRSKESNFKILSNSNPLEPSNKAMERAPSERPLIRYIDCEDDLDLYAGMVGACSMGHDQGQGHGYGQGQGQGHGYGYGQGQGFSQGHDQGHGYGQGFSQGQGHSQGRRGSLGMGQSMMGNHVNNMTPNVNTYVTTGPYGRQPPTLKISTPSQTCTPDDLLDLDNRPLSNSKGPTTTTASTNTGTQPGTPPSPQGTPSPPRATPNKKTRFLHPAGSDPNKSPTAGSLEPHREGGWGWAVLVTASLSHAVNGGLALASPVLVSHMTTAFNGTSTLQAAVAVSTSWGSGALLSPLIAAMCLKYGPRSVCILGGFVAALGALFNSFSEQLTHVFISFSVIFSFGLAMCNQSSRVALRAYFRKTHRGKSRVYQSAPYIGACAYAYFLHAALESAGWVRGLQLTTLTVGLNLVLGLFFSKPRSPRGGGGGNGGLGRGKIGGCDTSPFSFKDCFGFDVLREPCLVKWLGIEATTCLVIRSPLLLMVTDTYDDSHFGALTGPIAIIVWGACAVVGSYIWRISKRWLPVSPLLFLREQLLLMCVIVMGMGVTSSTDAYIVTCAAMGLVYGGLESTLTLQTARLVPASQRNCAEGWATCFRGVALMVGTPIAVYVNVAAGRRWPGYLLCGAVYTIAICVLLVFMGDIRERELDMQPPPPSSTPRPPILLEVTPAAPQNNPLIDGPEYEVDTSKLHVEDEGPEVIQDGGGGNGIVLGYLGEDQVRAVDTGDYRWAKIFTGVDAYTGRLLLCKSYEGGDEYSEVMGHQRKRGYSEPALPVLQECPSQENSSLSRADNSILSLGVKDFDASSSTRGDGGSLVNASYACEEGDFVEEKALRSLPRKMSDHSLFKERISKGTSMMGSTATAGASGAVGGSRRLSLEVDYGDSGSHAYNFASHASGTNEEELKLLENEAPKSCYGTSGAFEKQCSLEGAIGGAAPPETLVETTV